MRIFAGTATQIARAHDTTEVHLQDGQMVIMSICKAAGETEYHITEIYNGLDTREEEEARAVSERHALSVSNRREYIKAYQAVHYVRKRKNDGAEVSAEVKRQREYQRSYYLRVVQSRSQPKVECPEYSRRMRPETLERHKNGVACEKRKSKNKDDEFITQLIEKFRGMRIEGPDVEISDFSAMTQET